jgi:hypothetical protein
MLKLQEVKMSLSDAALGEGTGVKLNKLSVKDIKYVSNTYLWINFPAECSPALWNDYTKTGKERWEDSSSASKSIRLTLVR